MFSLALGACCVYLLAQLVFPSALLSMRRSFRLADDAALPAVSVLVACKNEQIDLPRCLAALEALDYPRERLEVVLVDDESSDGTLALLHAAVARNAHFRLYETRNGASTTLRGKARAIELAARHASGEWLFITDADGAVRPGWLRHMLSRAEAKTGLLAGAVVTEPIGFVGAIECAAYSFVMPFGLGVQALGGKSIASGPNMAVRREVYEAAGGLEASGIRVAEDMAFERMANARGFGTVAYADAETAVIVKPVPSFVHLCSQQRRWLLAGIEGDWVMYAFVQLGLGSLALVFVTLIAATLTLGAQTLPLWGAVALANVYGTYVYGRCTGLSLAWVAPALLFHQVFLWPWLYVSTLLVRRIVWRGEAYVLTFDP